jgi:hypothetical protein
MTSEEIYLFLKKHLTAENLQEISLRLIEAYKHKNTLLLQSYAEQIHLETENFSDNDNRLFLKLIKHFHPDRLGFLRLDIESSYKEKKHERLVFYRDLLTAKQCVEIRRARRFAYTPEEEHRYDAQDIGYSVRADGDSMEDEWISEVEVEMDFLHALKSAYLGNLDLHIDHAELETLEGDLTLSDYGIADLDGLHYCRYVSSLNLSYNRISSVYELRHLTELKELYLNNNCIVNIDYLEMLSSLEILDLSNNEIENGQVLSKLHNLRFLDIRNNPLDHHSIAPLLTHEDLVVML